MEIKICIKPKNKIITDDDIITINAKNKKDFWQQVEKYKGNWYLWGWYWRHKWFN